MQRRSGDPDPRRWKRRHHMQSGPVLGAALILLSAALVLTLIWYFVFR
jgi:hypothetical protein